MAPLITLVGTTALLAVLGLLGVRRLRPWPVPLRGGLAAMFTVTGVAHFVGMRDTLVAMVPPALPAPELLVTVTGVLELAGAAGLLWHRTAPWAAAGLALMLVAMFPANVYAITQGVSTGLTESLPVRTAMQAVFVAATTMVLVPCVGAWRGRRRQTPAERQAVPRA
ncbi:DoxX family protein [Nocardiopsis metallicus]|uniref:Putative membrane protein n=1 Tax=Nocardiopsis metallicus TaxID=179819 RepID=A0A840WJ17_9ACTN|nr:DoxX family membrane protein [Nocardiopsis metallicus]MBB5495453.1 putative membrane protein [Nocardiopsis metallicus]